jgi:23S rRNA pseudouridine2605 synthase
MKSNSKQKLPPLFPLRLNKYISYSGICSRRKADEFIKSGLISVNGKIIKEPGYIVENDSFSVFYEGKRVYPSQNFIYILLNKPKDCITTLTDEKGRKTIFDILNDPSLPRLFPVGRLDRNTTGVILLTNDGNLCYSLSHPSSHIKKEYVAHISPEFSNEELLSLQKGITLDGKLFKPDIAEFISGDKSSLGISIHYGQYHIVKRMIESFAHKVLSLDRITFAGISKKGLSRSKWRFLNNEEIRYLRSIQKKSK